MFRRRMVAFVDRRGGDVSEPSAWLYEPPRDCRTIPKDFVPDCFINASMTTLLPHCSYFVNPMVTEPSNVLLSLLVGGYTRKYLHVDEAQSPCSPVHRRPKDDTSQYTPSFKRVP